MVVGYNICDLGKVSSTTLNKIFGQKLKKLSEVRQGQKNLIF